MEIYLDEKKHILAEIDFEGDIPFIKSILPRKYFKELNPRIEDSLVDNLYNLIDIEQSLEDPNCYILKIGDEKFFEFNRLTEEVKKYYALTSFEVRRLGQAKYYGNFIGEGRFLRPAIFPRSEHKEFSIRTDLHAHLSAVLSGAMLIEIGEENNILYPLKIAEFIGLNVEDLIPDEYGCLRLNDILSNDPNNVNILEDSLEICPYTNETFNRMEEIYKAREPFTKNKDILEPILWKIAQEYVENGIEYAELSSTEVIKDIEFLCKIHEILPKIEEFWNKRGKIIHIRFLAAITRDAIQEKKEDELDILKAIAKSPYIVGCDFLGHESNPASVIAPEIKEITRWALVNDLDFTIRVHAGETDIFNNVEMSLSAIAEVLEEPEFAGHITKIPPIRIGHAVYKVKSAEVCELAKRLHAIFECNPTSNYSLNNVSDYHFPAARNIKNGIPTVIATDGFGLYGTTPRNEVDIAKGRKIEEWSLVSQVEEDVITRSNKRFEEKRIEFDHAIEEQLEKLHTGNISYLFRVDYRNGAPRYDGTKKERIDQEERKIREAHIEFLRRSLENTGCNILNKHNSADFKKRVKGKKPVLIVNESLRAESDEIMKTAGKNFLDGNEETRKYIDFLVENCDPEKMYFVIGGIKCGAEKYLLEKLSSVSKKFTVLSFVTQQFIMNEDTTLLPDIITDAIIIENKSSNILSSNFLLPKEIGDYLKANTGILVAMGGGAVVADMVQYAFNIGNINMYLGVNIQGTARKKARQYDDITKNRDGMFLATDAIGLARLFRQNNPEILSRRLRR